MTEKAREEKPEDLVRLHQNALLAFDEIQEAQREEREQCVADRRFYSIAGAQWEGDLGEQFENKPKFEVNKIHLSIIRIISEYRNNRITVNFVSKDGSPNDDLAEACNGLYRADEQDSRAEESYDNGFEEGVGGGIGGYRLTTQYEDEEDPDADEQRIVFEPIYDADSSIFFDLQAKRQDKSDAKFCFVLSSYTYDAYREEWDDEPTTFPKEVYQYDFDWCKPNVVYVAEYYKVETKKETIHIWTSLFDEEKRLNEEEHQKQKKDLRAKGWTKTRTKKIRRRRVHKYILSGNKILEDCGYIAGPNIPVVPVYGKRWFIENIERCMGHVRLAKDAQRLKNVQLSKLGEISSLGSVAKPIFTPEQVKGVKHLWEEDNIKNYPYLLVNAIKDVNGNAIPSGPVDYTRTAEVPEALAALLKITEDDINNLLGNQHQGEEVHPNVAQGTVELIQNRLDMQTFIYLSNMAKAVRRGGEIWLGMAKEVYVESGRLMKTVGMQNEVGQIELLAPGIDENGNVIAENDLTTAKFDVYVDVGPSSSTKRAATIRTLISMAGMTDDPETKQVLGAMAMMNMEGEGVSEVRDYFRQKLIRLGVIKPTNKEAQELKAELENREPTSEEKYFEAAAKKEEAEAVEKQANTILKKAQAEKAQADTLKTLSETEQEELRVALETVERLTPNLLGGQVPV